MEEIIKYDPYRGYWKNPDTKHTFVSRTKAGEIAQESYTAGLKKGQLQGGLIVAGIFSTIGIGLLIYNNKKKKKNQE